MKFLFIYVCFALLIIHNVVGLQILPQTPPLRDSLPDVSIRYFGQTVQFALESNESPSESVLRVGLTHPDVGLIGSRVSVPIDSRTILYQLNPPMSLVNTLTPVHLPGFSFLSAIQFTIQIDVMVGTTPMIKEFNVYMITNCDYLNYFDSTKLDVPCSSRSECVPSTTTMTGYCICSQSPFDFLTNPRVQMRLGCGIFPTNPLALLKGGYNQGSQQITWLPALNQQDFHIQIWQGQSFLIQWPSGNQFYQNYNLRLRLQLPTGSPSPSFAFIPGTAFSITLPQSIIDSETLSASIQVLTKDSQLIEENPIGSFQIYHSCAYIRKFIDPSCHGLSSMTCDPVLAQTDPAQTSVSCPLPVTGSCPADHPDLTLSTPNGFTLSSTDFIGWSYLVKPSSPSIYTDFVHISGIIGQDNILELNDMMLSSDLVSSWEVFLYMTNLPGCSSSFTITFSIPSTIPSPVISHHVRYFTGEIDIYDDSSLNSSPTIQNAFRPFLIQDGPSPVIIPLLFSSVPNGVRLYLPPEYQRSIDPFTGVFILHYFSFQGVLAETRFSITFTFTGCSLLQISKFPVTNLLANEFTSYLLSPTKVTAGSESVYPLVSLFTMRSVGLFQLTAPFFNRIVTSIMFSNEPVVFPFEFETNFLSGAGSSGCSLQYSETIVENTLCTSQEFGFNGGVDPFGSLELNLELSSESQGTFFTSGFRSSKITHQPQENTNTINILYSSISSQVEFAMIQFSSGCYGHAKQALSVSGSCYDFEVPNFALSKATSGSLTFDYTATTSLILTPASASFEDLIPLPIPFFGPNPPTITNPTWEYKFEFDKLAQGTYPIILKIDYLGSRCFLYTNLEVPTTVYPTCPNLFTGYDCEICPLQCQNGGSFDSECTKCECTNFFSGENCEICPLSCLNGGSSDSQCTKCECTGLFLGENCQTCPLQCQNGGSADSQCSKCNCTNSFAGDRCETCSLQCQNGGSFDRQCSGCICRSESYSGASCQCRKIRWKLTLSQLPLRIIEEYEVSPEISKSVTALEYIKSELLAQSTADSKLFSTLTISTISIRTSELNSNNVLDISGFVVDNCSSAGNGNYPELKTKWGEFLDGLKKNGLVVENGDTIPISEVQVLNDELDCSDPFSQCGGNNEAPVVGGRGVISISFFLMVLAVINTFFP